MANFLRGKVLLLERKIVIHGKIFTVACLETYTAD